MGFNFPNTPTIDQLWPSPPVDGQPVYRWDGEKWTSSGVSEKTYAPLDALGWSGLQINGSMEVSQETGLGTGLPVSGSSRWVADQWLATSLGPVGTTWFQSNTVLPIGFSRALIMTVTTAAPSPAAGDVVFLQQAIEGYRTSRLAWGAGLASPITVGFWVLSAVRTGMCSGSIRNVSDNRSYVFTFTITASNTWEYKTVTVPGDTAGAWANNNSAGIKLCFTPMAGTSFQTTPNVWTGGNFLAAPGTANFVTSTADVLVITGLVVLPGIEAPSAERSPLIMRPYGEELAICRRYYQLVDGGIAGVAAAGASWGVRIPCNPVMRAIPTIIPVYTTVNISSVVVDNPSTFGFRIYGTAVAAGAFDLNANSTKCDARL